MEKGKVILAGAGPGDPELITLRAAYYLQAADVVITDRLVSRELLERFVKPGAKIIHVGKEGHARGSTPQASINELLVSNFSWDKLLVRLKGGDVAFFSNVLDELETLVAHGIPFEIVPGITAASGASAYAGIPLTARGLARGVRFLTYYNDTAWPAPYWADLAATDDTLVLYMSACKLHDFALRLLGRGAASDLPVAVIEQATTPFQRVHTLSLEAATQPRRYISPSLVIIGKVVTLHQDFAWSAGTDAGRYFDTAAHGACLNNIRNHVGSITKTVA